MAALTDAEIESIVSAVVAHHCRTATDQGGCGWPVLDDRGRYICAGV